MNDKLKKFWKQITADKKRFGAMAALLGVALLMWGRLLLKDVPRTAVAEPKEKEAQAAPFVLPKRPVVYVDLPQESARNPFAMDPAAFGFVEKPKTVIATQNLAPEKSEEEKRAAIESALKGLKLRSTILGAQPHALIDDRILTLGGEPVPQFVITAITERSVTVQHTETKLEFELKMVSPDSRGKSK